MIDPRLDDIGRTVVHTDPRTGKVALGRLMTGDGSVVDVLLDAEATPRTVDTSDLIWDRRRPIGLRERVARFLSKIARSL